MCLPASISKKRGRRYYPLGAFATQLLGLTTIDGVGQAGLESSLNGYLSGKEGSILEESTARAGKWATARANTCPPWTGAASR